MRQDAMINSGEQDAAEAMRQRLQADLRLAMKGRVALDLAVLRMLIAALDNAGSVPLSAESGPRQNEVERRRLSRNDVEAILRREHEARQAAAKEFARLGLSMESMQAAREMAVVGRYLPVPAQR
jgi:uncharacterized protein